MKREFILIALLVSGCSNEFESRKDTLQTIFLPTQLKAQKEVAKGTNIELDQSTNTTLVQGPTIKINFLQGANLKGLICKTREIRITLTILEFNVNPNALSDFTQATDSSGNVFEVFNGEIEPEPDTKASEVVFGKDYIESAVSSGLQFTFSGERTLEVHLPAFYVRSFLKTLNEQLNLVS